MELKEFLAVLDFEADYGGAILRDNIDKLDNPKLFNLIKAAFVAKEKEAYEEGYAAGELEGSPEYKRGVKDGMERAREHARIEESYKDGNVK